MYMIKIPIRIWRIEGNIADNDFKSNLNTATKITLNIWKKTKLQLIMFTKEELKKSIQNEFTLVNRLMILFFFGLFLAPLDISLP